LRYFDVVPHPKTAAGAGPGEIDFDEGFIFGGGVGLYSDCFCGSRFEIEGIAMMNDSSTCNFSGITTTVDGEAETYAAMLNVLKEFPLGCVTGYAGLGIGFAWTDLTLEGGFSASDHALAYQAIVGGDYPINDCVSLFAQYKLLGIADSVYSSNGLTLRVEDYFTHSFSVGARLSF
jgi:hypothetical protein